MLTTIELASLILLLLLLTWTVKLYLELALIHSRYKYLRGRHTAKTAENFPLQKTVFRVMLQPRQAWLAQDEICLESSCKNYWAVFKNKIMENMFCPQ